MRRLDLLPALAGLLVVVALGPAAAQPPAAPPAPPAAAPATPASLTPAQLDRLTAPIALYPDPLLAQILMAATYPLEIVEADRWLQEPGNAALHGAALAAALAPLGWDPSIKSLAAFPQILAMMDKYLTWTERLGDAFLADQPAVMDSVQRLRRMAEAAGRLQSTPEEAVSQAGGPIVIEPAMPDTVYVPVYDPNAAYGAWPYPDQPPYYFSDVYPAAPVGPLGFGWIEIVIVKKLFGWSRCGWRHHRIDIDALRFAALGDRRQPATPTAVWQHDAAHRGGVPYPAAVRARFASAAAMARRMAVEGVPSAQSAPPPRAIARLPAAIVRPAPPILRGATPPPTVLRGAMPPPTVLRGAPSYGPIPAMRAGIAPGGTVPALHPPPIAVPAAPKAIGAHAAAPVERAAPLPAPAALDERRMR